MTLSTYRTSPYWKAAIDLGPALARLADELPASEEVGLSRTLRKLAVELPTAIAGDLLFGTAERRPVALKLTAALEMVDRIYPALDTAATRAAADALAEDLLADNFAPAEAAPAPAPVAPVSVPVMAAAEPMPASPLGPVPAPATVENHVQPDSQE